MERWIGEQKRIKTEEREEKEKDEEEEEESEIVQKGRPTAPGVPVRSPITVLTQPDCA